MSGGDSRIQLPIIPLLPESVLFPGVTLSIPVTNRADIPALLNAVYAKAARPNANAPAVQIGCVPYCSSLLSPEGQRLIEGGESSPPRPYDNPAKLPTGDNKDLFAYGTLARISGVQGRRPGELALIVDGVQRIKVERFTQFKPYMEAEVTTLEDENADAADVTAQASFQHVKQLSRELLTLVRLSSLLPRSNSVMSPILARRLELFITKKDFTEAGLLCDFMTNVVDSTFEEKLQVLAALEIKVRLERVVEMLRRQVDNMKSNVKITTVTTSNTPPDISNLPKDQKDQLIRRVMASLGRGSGSPGAPGSGSSSSSEEEVDEIEELRQKLEDAKLTPEASKVAEKELKRLKKMNPAQAEYGVCRTYLENLAEIPWSARTEDQLGPNTLERARQQLNNDHYGLEKIKKRLLEYLAVLRLKQSDLVGPNEVAEEAQQDTEDSKTTELPQDSREDQPSKALPQLVRTSIGKSPILLLVGPPGTGKTSLAKSVAAALGRKFHRISLGGIRDEAEIRGHRRTYVAAMPGLIVNGLKKVGVNNPVFLLDEIDKVGGANFHGDPSAAMLEVLDPEQNHTFVDHYVNIPIDLSKVLFIATANSLDTIPPPLLDRMETISLSGYTTVEKRHIATRHLIPKQITSNALSEPDVIFSDAVIDEIIVSYTRESGVRNLEREIGSVCRAKAVQYSDARDSERLADYKAAVEVDDLEDILGPPRYDDELADKSSVPGVVTGLVAYSFGGQGSILFIEIADMPGKGRVQLTGKLGDVLKESVEVALSWVKAHAFELGIVRDADADIMARRAIHVHCPSGAIPKDGPSAGLAHTVALISLFSGRAVRPDLAMTGEISLRGRVLPVGGIKEKLIGAMRAGVTTVLIPKGNSKDTKELPDEVKRGLKIVEVSGIWEALKTVWPDHQFQGWDIESRL